MSTTTTTTYGLITVVLKGTEEGRLKALAAYDAKEAAKQAAYDAISAEERLANWNKETDERIERERIALDAKFAALWDDFDAFHADAEFHADDAELHA